MNNNASNRNRNWGMPEGRPKTPQTSSLYRQPSARPDISEEDLAAVKLGDGLKPELYSVTAEKIARLLSNGGVRKNQTNQIRRFYDELANWGDRVRLAKPGERDEVFAACAPYINMLVARAAYAKGRELVTPGFESLIKRLVNEIKGPETLKQGKLFFEAVVGFKKGLESNN